MSLRQDSDYMIKKILAAVQPDAAVERALAHRQFGGGKLILIAVGKAAWAMGAAAKRVLGDRITCGVVITKYGHAMGNIDGVTIYEAAHPVPDQNSFAATEAALRMTGGLTADDTVLFLLSGGGSALFEAPNIRPEESADLTKQLLACGADIVEMNTVRKRFSKVKGGRFALHCTPAKVFSVVLSDIIGDPLDMIASGPAYIDSSTAGDAAAIVDRYQLDLTEEMRRLLLVETPKRLDNVESVVTGSVRQLCLAAADAAEELGYATEILTDSMDCEAREAGAFLAAIARFRRKSGEKLALIVGGETVVHLKGDGLGGRNQELALSAACGIRGLKNTALFSLGSDGTDGPTDAAGGYVDGATCEILKAEGVCVFEALEKNDAYHALQKCGGLLFTGPTGTNVNDVTVLLLGN